MQAKRSKRALSTIAKAPIVLYISEKVLYVLLHTLGEEGLYTRKVWHKYVSIRRKERSELIKKVARRGGVEGYRPYAKKAKVSAERYLQTRVCCVPGM
jgi:hypothetical protein